MHTAIDFDKISDILKQDNNILFAVLFGSYAKGNPSALSDVDIGIYTKNEISLLEIGEIVSNLERIVKKPVDLVVLNDLFKLRPNYAFQVVSSARLFFVKDEEEFVDFKRSVYLYYMDTKPLIDMVNASLKKRMDAGMFGERNYE